MNLNIIYQYYKKEDNLESNHINFNRNEYLWKESKIQNIIKNGGDLDDEAVDYINKRFSESVEVIEIPKIGNYYSLFDFLDDDDDQIKGRKYINLCKVISIWVLDKDSYTELISDLLERPILIEINEIIISYFGKDDEVHADSGFRMKIGLEMRNRFIPLNQFDYLKTGKDLGRDVPKKLISLLNYFK